MSFEGQIQQWVALDNELKRLNEKSREIREQKHKLEEILFDRATENNHLQATIKIGDNKLKFANTNVAEPLTFKYLEKTLKTN